MKKSIKTKGTKKSPNKDWGEAIKQAESELKSQRIYYKDKPVNGEPTDKQYNAIKGFCRSRELNCTLIGINRKEASEILAYFFDKNSEVRKPKCWDKYISQ